MKEGYFGLDVLRGLGIFLVIFLHTAFYYFAGIYDLDLNNPPLIVTIIGLLLMFAGMFAMISGFVHTHQNFRKIKEKSNKIFKYGILSGLLMLLVAYAYFIFTGPGIINFTNKNMNNSILVELIRNNKLISTNIERLFYVDSLVMIGLNIILISIFTNCIKNIKKEKRSLVFFGISNIIYDYFSY